MIHFPRKIHFPIHNHITGEIYTIVRSKAIGETPDRITELIRICNEEAIYDELFFNSCGGAGYNKELAREWFKWSRAGWAENSHFCFVALSPNGEIAAHCDIKSNRPSQAEIGYWASERHGGVMTNMVITVSHLAGLAGFESLSARTSLSNERSKRVLERAGFQASSEQQDLYHEHFILPLDCPF